MNDDRAAIETLLTHFGRCADRGDGEALSRLFLSTGTLTVNLKTAEGQAAISRIHQRTHCRPK